MRVVHAFLMLCCAAGLTVVVQTGCRGGGDPEATMITAARQAFLAGRLDTAESSYQVYLQRFAKGRFRLEAWRRLADIRVAMRATSDASLTLLDTAALEFAADQPVQASFLVQAAAIRLRRKEYDQAAVYFTKITALPEAPAQLRLDAYQQLAHIRALAHDQAGALAALRQCREDNQLTGQAQACACAMGELFFDQGRMDLAEPILQDIFAKPGNEPALRARAGLRLARLYEKQHETEKAKELYTQLLDVYPNKRLIQNRLDLLRK